MGDSNNCQNFQSFRGTKPSEENPGGVGGLTGCPGAGRDGGQNNSLVQFVSCDHAPSAVLCGQREYKDPPGSALMKKLRKQVRPQVRTNPDSGLKSHLAHYIQNNQCNPSRSWARGAWNVLEVLSDSTLPQIKPLTQHHGSDPLLVNCPHHYACGTESRQMRSHRKLSPSHQYLSVTLSTSAVSKLSHHPSIDLT